MHVNYFKKNCTCGIKLLLVRYASYTTKRQTFITHSLENQIYHQLYQACIYIYTPSMDVDINGVSVDNIFLKSSEK